MLLTMKPGPTRLRQETTIFSPPSVHTCEPTTSHGSHAHFSVVNACGGQVSRVSGLPHEEVVSKVDALRRAVEPAFRRRTPFTSGDLEDEYYFDMVRSCE